MSRLVATLIYFCQQDTNYVPPQFLSVTALDYRNMYTKPIYLTHWGRVTHTCASKLTIIGSGNGLSPGRHQTIIWTKAGILIIGPLGTNVNSNIFIQEDAFESVVCEMAAMLFWLQCVKHYDIQYTSGINVMKHQCINTISLNWCIPRTC